MRPATLGINLFTKMAYAITLGLVLAFANYANGQETGTDTPPDPASPAQPAKPEPDQKPTSHPQPEPEPASEKAPEKAPEKPQPDSRLELLSEAHKKLNDTTPADQRRKAIDEIIRILGDEPVVSMVTIIENRLPRRPFEDLLSLMQDQEGEKYRRAEFFPPLARAMMDDPELRRTITDILSMPSEAHKTLASARQLLSSTTARDISAGCHVARLRPQGTRGDVQLIRLMVPQLEGADEVLRTLLLETLRTLSHQRFDATAASWIQWLAGKSDFDLAAEIADAASAKLKEAETRNRALQDEVLRTVIERMQREEKDNPNLLTEHLTKNPNASVRLKAAELFANLLPNLQPAARGDAMSALASRFQAGVESDEQVLLACARALAKVKEHALAVVKTALRENGISKTVKLELVRALGSLAALEVIAEFLNTAPQLGDPVQLALIKQITVAVGTSTEAANAALEPIFAKLNERLTGSVKPAETDALQREADAILNTLNYLSQPIVGLSIAPALPALCRYGLSNLPQQSRVLNLLRQAAGSKPEIHALLKAQESLIPMLLAALAAEDIDRVLAALRLTASANINDPTVVAGVQGLLKVNAPLAKPVDMAEVVKALMVVQPAAELAQTLTAAAANEVMAVPVMLAINDSGEHHLVALATALVPATADASLLQRDRLHAAIRPKIQSPAALEQYNKSADLMTERVLSWFDVCFTNAEGQAAPSAESRQSLLAFAKGPRATSLLTKALNLLDAEAVDNERRRMVVEVTNACLASLEALKDKALSLSSESTEFAADLERLRTQLKEADVISGK